LTRLKPRRIQAIRATRTVQRRLLLTPGPLLTEITLGVLGRAQRLYGVAFCGFAFLSTHFHLQVIRMSGLTGARQYGLLFL
jgi:hypothetical protein